MIKIKHINAANTIADHSDEYNAAERLAKQFESDLADYQKATGTIYIVNSVSIFNQKRRDIDILIIGTFDNFTLRGKRNAKNNDNHFVVNELNVNSFICNIEVKSHTKIAKEGTSYIVKYPNGVENATEQCYEAKFSISNMLEKEFGIRVFICDLLWFTSISRDTLEGEKKGVKDNALPSTFSFSDFVDAMLLQSNVYNAPNNPNIDCFSQGRNYITTIIELFTAKRNIGGLTKKKFELLSQKDFDPSKLELHIGEKFTLISGRAGTGKTIQLLQLALYLIDKQNSRCLLLTYNNALVCDIRRLIDYFALPSKLNKRTLQINTVDSFFLELMKHLEVVNPTLNPSEPQYKGEYETGLNNLHDYIKKELSNEDVNALKDLIGQSIDWDYIFIDECQDWDEKEKDIIFKIYGAHRVIVADGVDQFNRCSRRLDWKKGLDRQLINDTKEMKLEMRQKANLARFVNIFAEENNISWNVVPNHNIPGGKVIITKGFKLKLYKKIYAEAQNDNCEKYDILFLVPPSDVKDGHYMNYDIYNNKGISLFDGTNPANKKLYPTTDVSRVYQYDSCRGLEGWVVVCLNFDKLIDYKMQTYTYDPEGYPSSPQSQKDYSVFLWSLMPLTRPTDTLVICLENPNSDIGIKLKDIAKKYSSFIEWDCD